MWLSNIINGLSNILLPPIAETTSNLYIYGIIKEKSKKNNKLGLIVNENQYNNL
jgi:hypothetical protein